VLGGPYLYLGGSDDSKGVYWKISLLRPWADVIADTVQNATNISSIVISDTTRYMIGGSAGYWKNDSFIAVPSALYPSPTEASGKMGFGTTSTMGYFTRRRSLRPIPTS